MLNIMALFAYVFAPSSTAAQIGSLPLAYLYFITLTPSLTGGGILEGFYSL